MKIDYLRKTVLSVICASVILLTSCGAGTTPASQTPDGQSAQPAAQSSGPEASTAAPVEPAKEIVFWSTKEDCFPDECTEFTKETGIKVTATFMGGYDDMVDKVMAGIAANKLPDVAQLGQRHGIAQMYDSGSLLAIEDYMPKELMDDIIPGFWKRFTYKDKKVILPFQNSLPMLYYNKDLLQKAAAEVPTTLDSVVSTAKTIKDKTGVFGFSMNDDYPWYVLAMMYNSGVTPFTPDGKGNMNIPQTQSIFYKLKQMAVTDRSMPANQHKTAQEDFGNGKIAMFMGSCASYAKIQKAAEGKFGLGVAQFPEITTMDIPMGGNGLGIFRSTPEKEKASAMFAEFMLNKDLVASSTLKYGYIPVTNAATATDTYKEYLSDPNRTVVDKQMQYLGGAAVNPADSLVWNEILNLVDALEADPNVNISDRLAAINNKIDKYIDEYAGK